MGCSNSSHNCVSPKKEDSMEQLPPTSLTDQHRVILLDSWKVIQEDIAKVGVIMFMGLFETHPECKEVFMPFKELQGDDLRWSSALKAHGLRVMAVIERVLARIDSDEKIEEHLKALAKKHVEYGANSDLVRLFGPQFIGSMKRQLHKSWSDEMQDAWTVLFDIIIYHMTTNMVPEQPENNNIAKRQKSSRKSRTKYMIDNGHSQ
ncbi:uncharacterized protein LOC100375093 [Saccoglossus kowalevskii]|uniref:Cytoglobin-1-like n=1 Tax=Saccoglossus kowalevskii TaxID=10224 RepID=A0ABM0GX11_SACKO|nr:PREDICTED: cytoglobin-1-like [Saccoglossus kowalevskii]